MTVFDVLKDNPGLGRAEALRRTMLAFLADPSLPPYYAYPAIWGPFSLVGEGAAQPGQPVMVPIAPLDE
jgi:hypothetical protein